MTDEELIDDVVRLACSYRVGTVARDILSRVSMRLRELTAPPPADAVCVRIAVCVSPEGTITGSYGIDAGDTVEFAMNRARRHCMANERKSPSAEAIITAYIPRISIPEVVGRVEANP